MALETHRHTRQRMVSAPPADVQIPTTPRSASMTRSWSRRLSWFAWITDLVILTIVVFSAQVIWFASFNAQVSVRPVDDAQTFGYSAVSLALVVGWMWALALADSRSPRVLGSGIIEYRRVADASFRLFGAVAIIALFFKVDIARGYLLVALPAGVVLLLLARWGWNQWLVYKRRRGGYAHRVVLVGSSASVAQIARELHRHPEAGYHVVGACLPGWEARNPTMPGIGVPILATIDSVEEALSIADSDTVIVTSSDDLPPDRVKRLSWNLEAGRQHLVLSPSILDIAGPRIHSRPVAGLPLIHVETPKLSKGQLFVKRMLDLFLSLFLVTVLSPLLLILSIVVKSTSRGPVIFTQARIGRHGTTFSMLKFRSMVADAEDLLPSMLDEQRDSGNEILFKMRHDPRVTPVGRWMRRFSLDELPQLFNVIGGTMSIVGPRPPLASEVEKYADHVHRRFMMKPGITGLWQVSGRSTLSWEDTVRLDLSYVENYSLVGDLVILVKTVRAVAAPGDSAH